MRTTARHVRGRDHCDGTVGIKARARACRLGGGTPLTDLANSHIQFIDPTVLGDYFHHVVLGEKLLQSLQ